MPHEITLKELPGGYALHSAKGGDELEVEQAGFYSSEDGDVLIQRLEGWPQTCLALVTPSHPVNPAALSALLIVIRRDNTATVYVNNEVSYRFRARPKRAMTAGAVLTPDDLTDIDALKFDATPIPDDAGMIFFFQVGWRRGLYFNFAPLHRESQRCTSDELSAILGRRYAYLMFQERYKIDAATWSIFLAQRWFPFAHLSSRLLCDMIASAREGWRIDDLLPRIADELNELLSVSPIVAFEGAAFADHLEVLGRAVERFQAGDHVSCNSIIYPRIEGVLRSYRRAQGLCGNPSASELTAAAVNRYEGSHSAMSALLPARFRQFLEVVYFAHFAPGSGPDAGRHSVAHGEAREDSFDLKASAIGLLILYQLSHFIGP